MYSPLPALENLEGQQMPGILEKIAKIDDTTLLQIWIQIKGGSHFEQLL